jgi:hypothetical protein
VPHPVQIQHAYRRRLQRRRIDIPRTNFTQRRRMRLQI